MRSLIHFLLLLPVVSQAADLDTFEVGSLPASNAAARTVLIPESIGLRVDTGISGAIGTATYRIGYKLTNSAEESVSIILMDTDKGTVLEDESDNGLIYSPNLTPVSGNLSTTHALALSSELALDDYRVTVVLEYLDGLNWKVDKLNVTSPVSSPFELRVFPNSTDLNRNIKLRVDALAVDREVLFSNIDGADAFILSADLRALRYDVDAFLVSSLNASASAVFVEADGSTVPALVSKDGVTFASSTGIPLGSISASASGSPTSKSISERLYLRPAAPLKTGSEVTAIRLTTTHNDYNGLGFTSVTAIPASVSSRLFISDSQLRSGPASAAIDAIDAIGTISVSGETATVSTTGLQGSLATGHTFTANATVSVDANGITTLVAPFPIVLTAPATPDEVLVNGILMKRGTVALTATGPTMSGGQVRLPRGLGWVLADGDYGYAGNVAESWLKLVGDASGNIALDGSLLPPQTTITLITPTSAPAAPQTLALNEESKPFVWITDSIVWSPASAAFAWSTNDIIACHDDEWDLLEEAAASVGGPTSAAWLTKRDNRAFLRKPRIAAASGSLSNPEVVVAGTGAAGDARIFGRIDLGYPGSGAAFNLYPQAPMGSQITWNHPGGAPAGTLVLDNDHFTGTLSGVSAITQEYYRNGIEDPCLGASLNAFSTLLPASNQVLHLTPDGGLLSPALLFNPASANRTLEIGSTLDETGANTAVHAVSGWSDNSIDFLMAGTSLAGASGWHSARMSSELGVSTLLNTGFSIDTTTTPATVLTERPGTAAYSAGEATYPGLNFRVAAAPAESITGFTYLGDARIPAGSDTYTLRPNSKYYVRLGGTNGTHDVDFTTQRGVYPVYGYELDFYQFGLAYLNNLNGEYGLDSTVAADLRFSSAPLTGFSLAFDRMSVTGGGDLQSGDLLLDVDNPKEPLTYWSGQAIPRSFAFNPKTADACAKIRLLVLGVETYAALIDSPLHGYLAIASSTTPGLGYSNGSLVSLTDAAGFDNTRPRIFLPGLVRMRGPALTVGGQTSFESYPIHPVADAYFNNYDIAGRPDTGFIAFGATMGVAFFEDLRIHLRTPAASAPDTATADTAAIHLSGGWSDGGKTFWDHPADYDFDADHKGWDGNFTAYWTENHESSAYDIRAEQDIFGLIEISYPVQWNPTLRQFTGNKQAVDLIVLNANHKLDFLTAERASITFGVKAGMDGIPNLNLGSIAMNATGAADGILATLSQSASAKVGQILDRGTQSVNSLLKDVPEEIFSQAWDTLIAPRLLSLDLNAPQEFNLFDDLIEQLDTAAAYSTDVENAIKDYFLPSGNEWFFSVATDAMQALDQTGSVIRQIDSSLADLQNGIRSISSFSVSSLSAEAAWEGSVETLQADGTVLILNWSDLSNKAISDF